MLVNNNIHCFIVFINELCHVCSVMSCFSSSFGLILSVILTQCLLFVLTTIQMHILLFLLFLFNPSSRHKGQMSDHFTQQIVKSVEQPCSLTINNMDVCEQQSNDPLDKTKPFLCCVVSINQLFVQNASFVTP